MNIKKSSEQKAHERIKGLIFGKPMSGKTTFATKFPNALLISTDGNYKGFDAEFDIYDLKQTADFNGQQVPGWELFKKDLKEIATSDYKTIVVDLVSDMYEIARKTVLNKAGVSHESEDGRMGMIYDIYRKDFLSVIGYLISLDKNIILIAHSIDDGPGVTVDINKKMFNKLTGKLDFAVRFDAAQTPKGIKRILRTGTEPGNQGGSRYKMNDIIDPTPEKLLEEIKKVKGE